MVPLLGNLTNVQFSIPNSYSPEAGKVQFLRTAGSSIWIGPFNVIDHVNV
jgi:hypothetical protein